MQAFLLLFGLLFRPGASVRLKTVGESWDGPPPPAGKAQQANVATVWMVNHVAFSSWVRAGYDWLNGMMACGPSSVGPSQLSPTVFRRTLAPGWKRRPKSRRKACMAER